ncbi:MAG: hypothetical protein ACREVI_16435 [Steroidobacteraceae bacterium]
MLKAFPVLLFITFCTGAISAEQSMECEAPQYRQLDFWIGNWNVIDQTTGKQVGASRIEKQLNGCLIHEFWNGTDQFTGQSFNLYNRETKHWQQVWVDSRGQRIDFTGQFHGDGLYYEGTFRSAGKEVLTKMTFLKIKDQRVRQIWEQSNDQGESWKVVFDGLYVRTSK